MPPQALNIVFKKNRCHRDYRELARLPHHCRWLSWHGFCFGGGAVAAAAARRAVSSHLGIGLVLPLSATAAPSAGPVVASST